MTTLGPELDRVLRQLAAFVYDASTEAAFQEGVARALAEGGIAFEREVELAQGDRIDFLADGGIGLDLKIHGAETEVARQLLRYARSPRVTALILATTRSKHRGIASYGDGQLGGKPILVYWQGGIS